MSARDLTAAREILRGHRPKLGFEGVSVEAAVALLLRDGEADLEVLMIRRAQSEGDRWSGHIAFPGGRVDPTDAGARRAAERETLEEVGVELGARQLLGQLDDLRGTAESIRVSGFVYGLESSGAAHPSDPPLTLNYEVAEAFWMPIDTLQDPARHALRPFRYLDREIELPAIRVLEGGGPLLWGISYRFLDLLLGLLDRPIPTMGWNPDA